jgi:hypothetical protein
MGSILEADAHRTHRVAWRWKWFTVVAAPILRVSVQNGSAAVWPRIGVEAAPHRWAHALAL